MTTDQQVDHQVDKRTDTSFLARHVGAGMALLTRFGTIGLVAFVVDVTVFNLLRQGLDVGPLTSKVLAALVTITVAFVGNRSWTFGDRAKRNVGSAYVRFFAVNGVGLLIQLGCLALSTYALGLTSPLAENISGNGVGLVLATCFRFWAYHRWVFVETEGPVVESPVPDLPQRRTASISRRT